MPERNLSVSPSSHNAKITQAGQYENLNKFLSIQFLFLQFEKFECNYKGYTFFLCHNNKTKFKKLKTIKKISLLSIFIFLVLNSIFAVTYDNLYVVGNACSAGWNPDGALVMVQESENNFLRGAVQLKKEQRGIKERFKIYSQHGLGQPH